MVGKDLAAEIISAGQAKNIEKLESLLQETETKQVNTFFESKFHLKIKIIPNK